MIFLQLDSENYEKVIKPIIYNLSIVLENKNLQNVTNNKNDLQELKNECQNDSVNEMKISIGFFGGILNF
jgi:hypothetical protein